MRTGIVAKLIWGDSRYKIYENTKDHKHCFYDRNEEVYNGTSFNEVYAFSLKYRNIGMCHE